MTIVREVNNIAPESCYTCPEAFKEPFVLKQKTIAEYKDFLKYELRSSLVDVSSPKFIGHMTGPVPPFIHELQQWVGQLNQNMVKFETSGAGTFIERQVLGCFHRLFYNETAAFYDRYIQEPAVSLGNVTSGGTLSNLTALSYALSNKLNDAGAMFKEDGLAKSLQDTGYRRAVIMGSSHCHYSLQKVMRLLGLGTNAFISLDTYKLQSNNGRQMLDAEIRSLKADGVLVIALVGVAGTTEAGKIDPLEMMAEVAAENQIHFHVDAAFGGAFSFSDRLSAKLSGISCADSITLCGHKQLYLPMGTSLCLFKSPGLVKQVEINSYYQARKGSVDLGKYTIEGSRPFSALIFHGALQVVGKEGYTEILESNYDRAMLFTDMIRSDSNFQLYMEPDLNIVLYRYIPDVLREKAADNTLTDEERNSLNELNIYLQQEQFRQKISFVSYTELPDPSGKRHVWLRSVFMNQATTHQHLKEILEEQRNIVSSYKNKNHE
jgi:glutamate decarboxylase